MRLFTRTLGMVVTVMFAISLNSCGGGGGGATSPTSPTTNPAPIISGSATIGTGGGNLQTSNGVIVTIPPNTVTSPTVVNVNQYNSSSMPFAKPVASSGSLNITNAMEVSANGTVNGSPTVSVPITDTTKDSIVAYWNGSSYQYLAGVKAGTGQSITASLPTTSVSHFRLKNKSLSGTIWQIIVGIVASKDDHSLGLKLLSGDGDTSHGISIVLVHGIMSNDDSMNPIGSWAKSALSANNVYSLSYDWTTASTNGTFNYLKDTLNNNFPSKSVIIIAHSYGCLVSRYVMEKMYATKSVRGAILIAGPHEGCALANVTTLQTQLATEWLNHSYSGAPPIDPNTLALQEMVPGSKYLSFLNRDAGIDLGSVPYYLCAGTFLGNSDGIVSTSSARADDIDMLAHTQGIVLRHNVSSANHCNIVTDQLPIRDIIGFYKDNKPYGAYLSMNFANTSGNATNQIDASPDDGFWHWQVTFTNNSYQNVTFQDMSMEAYCQNGDFDGTSWYPGGTVDSPPYLHTYWTIDNQLAPGQSKSLAFTTNSEMTTNGPVPVWNQTDPRNRAFRDFLTVRYLLNGNPYEQQIGPLILTYNADNDYPVPVQPKVVQAGSHKSVSITRSRNNK